MGGCVDIDECKKGKDNCHKKAKCTNTLGSFTCECKEDYKGDGVTCEKIDDVCGIDDGNDEGPHYVDDGCHSEADKKKDDFVAALKDDHELYGVRCCSCDGATCTTSWDCATGKQMNYKDAKAYCAKEGKRLCTLKELQSDMCCGTGGDCDSHGTWTSTTSTKEPTGDDCEDGNNTCGPTEQCVTTKKGYECKCKAGFKKDKKKGCVDINECKKGTDNCHKKATCTNTEGGFTCKCKDGYKGDGVTCEKESDPCEGGKNKCGKNAVCDSEDGAVTCTCKDGFEGNGKMCKDIDECKEQLDNCDADAVCTNTVGGFECACKDGFQGDGETCQDVNECKKGMHKCHKHATCENTVGGLKCTCKKGWKGDGETCEKADECEEGTDTCKANEKCVTTKKGFKCECAAGYKKDKKKGCVDIDECKKGKDNCHKKAKCTNTDGGFTCECKEDYKGDGVTCEKIEDVCKMDDGNDEGPHYVDDGCHSEADKKQDDFVAALKNDKELYGVRCCSCDGATCTTSWDCATGKQMNYKDAKAYCAKEGKRLCTLKELQSDMCCGTGGDCDSHGTWTSTTSTKEPTGDECEDGTHTCGAKEQCVTTKKGYECKCKAGFKKDKKKGCVDINECKKGTDNCHKKATCTN